MSLFGSSWFGFYTFFSAIDITEKIIQRFVNFYAVTREELESLARINGRADVHALDLSDIFTISNEVARNTDIAYA